ncbi:hypothetical protein AgCh_008134 [Apium graveolens]
MGRLLETYNSNGGRIELSLKLDCQMSLSAGMKCIFCKREDTRDRGFGWAYKYTYTVVRGSSKKFECHVACLRAKVSQYCKNQIINKHAGSTYDQRTYFLELSRSRLEDSARGVAGFALPVAIAGLDLMISAFVGAPLVSLSLSFFLGLGGDQVDDLDKMGKSAESEFEFVHGSHKHTLREHHAREPYKCNGCKMPGSRTCFKCVDELCNFYLHLDCFTAEQVTTLRHPLLEDCDFDYHKSPPPGEDVPYCDACGLDILGFRYRCFTKSHLHNPHDLHPTCANLEEDMIWGRFKLKLLDNVESRCLHCDEKYPTEDCIRFTGWKWVAENHKYWGYPFCFSGKKICFHVKCMNEIQAPAYRRNKH